MSRSESFRRDAEVVDQIFEISDRIRVRTGRKNRPRTMRALNALFFSSAKGTPELINYLLAKDCLMLVLSRRERQTIVIGHEEIELTVLEIHGRTVKIGINAPAGVPIVRGELCDSTPLCAAAPAKLLTYVRAVRGDSFAAIGQETQKEMAVA